MTKQPSSKRTAIFLTMIAAGIFLIGAAVLPLLARAQADALDNSTFTRLPSTSNYAAPKLALTDLQGNPVTLEDYLGKVILVNNWATWCPPCKAEMPEIQTYYQEHSSDNFIVIAIESGEPAKTVANFVSQHGLTFPIWLDPHGAALEAFQNWDLPSTYIIDQAGTVRMSWTGQLNLDTLEKYITPLLEE